MWGSRYATISQKQQETLKQQGCPPEFSTTSLLQSLLDLNARLEVQFIGSIEFHIFGIVSCKLIYNFHLPTRIPAGIAPFEAMILENFSSCR